MTTFWEILRFVDFILLFASFVILMYRAVYKAFVAPELLSWVRIMNLIWSLIASVAVGELIVRDVEAEVPRVIIFFIAGSLQLWVVLFKSPFMDPSMVVKEKYKNS